MTDLSNLKFFQTPPHSCSYLEDLEATTVFVDPNAPIDSDVYTNLSRLGFRRSGKHLYRPHCQSCSACIPVRIPVAQFKPKRSQRRTFKRTSSLSVRWEPARFTPELYQLYARYINQRHQDGDMFPPSEEQFASFLMGDSQWSQTQFMVLYDADKPVSVAVTDRMSDGFSAIYTFFDPEQEQLSLGTVSILHQIEASKRLGLPYLYLGYWIQKCQKMNYKTAFQPLEYFELDRWHPFSNSP